jgi:peptide/nickel transport system permease protein
MTTIGYIIRRVLQSVLVVLGALLITFVLFHLEGAQALARSIYTSPRASQTQINSVIQLYGFNLPVWDQFWHEIVRYVHLDFGKSPDTGQTVTSEISTALPRSLVLIGESTVFAIALALPLGVFQTVRRNKFSDYALTGLTFLFYAMPAFLLGELMILIFIVHLHWFGLINQSESISQVATSRNIIPPVLTLSAVTVASFSRYMRSSMMDAMTEDYVRTARAKGAGQSRVLFRHAFRNALIPIITLLGLSLPAIAGGAVITESVFNYPGMGFLTAVAAQSNQVEVVVGTTVVATVLTVAGSLLADVFYVIADPRIRYARH